LQLQLLVILSGAKNPRIRLFLPIDPAPGRGNAGPSLAAKLKLSLEQQKVGSRPLISSAKRRCAHGY
jgi:hypothetical protein